MAYPSNDQWREVSSVEHQEFALVVASDDYRKGEPCQLALNCVGGEIEVFIQWGTASLGVETAVHVGYQFGDGTIIYRDWQADYDGARTFYPGNARTFISGLLSNTTFTAMMSLSGEPPIHASFEVQWLCHHIGGLEKAGCCV